MSYSRFVSTIAAVCICTGILAGSAWAQQQKEEPKVTGLYGGAGIGMTSFDNPSDEDLAWRMQVWYRPSKYGSMEIGYINAGRAGNKAEADGLHLVAKPTLPLPMGFDVYGKIGGFFYDNSNCAVGLGASYRFPAPVSDFGLRLDWDNLDVEGHQQINVLTLGLFYQFAHY
jgi:hypothetical protein